MQDEVTGLAVSERFIIAQYFLEPEISVFDRKSLKLLHKLSGSKDHQVKVWDTKTGSLLLSLTQDAEITSLIPGQ